MCPDYAWSVVEPRSATHVLAATSRAIHHARKSKACNGLRDVDVLVIEKWYDKAIGGKHASTAMQWQQKSPLTAEAYATLRAQTIDNLRDPRRSANKDSVVLHMFNFHCKVSVGELRKAMEGWIERADENVSCLKSALIRAMESFQSRSMAILLSYPRHAC